MSESNLLSGRYKDCGFGSPLYNQDGDYDEVSCGYDKSTGFCGEIECPLNKIDNAEYKYGDR